MLQTTDKSWGRRGIVILDFTSVTASAHPVSFIMWNILAGCENSGVWSFSRNTFSEADFKAASVVCGGRNEVSVQTERSVRLTGKSRQLLEKKVTPEEVRPYPKAAPRASRSAGRLKIKTKDSDS